MILRPVWLQKDTANDSDDNTGKAWGEADPPGPEKPTDAIGYGFPVYWPWYQGFASEPATPPTKYWHKLGRMWEPRGGAALRPGTQHTHTYTVS